MEENKQPLTRDVKNSLVGGVCAGIAKHYNKDVSVVRLLTVAFILLVGSGLLVYIVAWILIPAEKD